MDRAYEANPASSAPTPPDPPLLGYPTEGSTPTEPGAWWFYMITEEIRAAIVAADLTPSATVVNQLAAAITAMADSAAAAALTSYLSSVLSAFKPNNTARSSTTIATADPNLVLTIPAAGVYELSGLLVFNGGAGGITIGLGETAALDGEAGASGSINGAAWTVSALSPGNTIYTGPISSLNGDWVRLSGLIRFSAAGSLYITWAQNTSNATATNMLTDSYIKLRPIAG